MKHLLLRILLLLSFIGGLMNLSLRAQNPDITLTDFTVISFFNGSIPADSLVYSTEEPLGGPVVFLADTLQRFTSDLQFRLQYQPAEPTAFVGLWLDLNDDSLFTEEERVYFGSAKEGMLTDQLTLPDFTGTRRALLAIDTDEKELADPRQIPANDQISSLQFIIRAGPPALTMTSKKDTRDTTENFCAEVPMELYLGPGHPCIVVDKWIAEYPVGNSVQVNAAVSLTSGGPFAVGTMLNANDYITFTFDFSTLPINDGDAVDFILQYADCSDPAILDVVTFTFTKDCNVSDLREARDLQEQFQLRLAPNPVSEESTISYQLPKGGPVELLLLDQQGRVLQQLQRTDLPAGEHRLQYHPRELPPGLYWLLLRTPTGYSSKKMLILGG